jgi:hypothetical protein
MAKWVAEVASPDRIADAGVPGPVVVAVLEDVLTSALDGMAGARQLPVHAAPRQRDVDIVIDTRLAAVLPRR